MPCVWVELVAFQRRWGGNAQALFSRPARALPDPRAHRSRSPSWLNTNNGWVLRACGERAHGSAPGGWRRLTVLGALAGEGMIAAMSIAAATTTRVFLAFLQTC